MDDTFTREINANCEDFRVSGEIQIKEHVEEPESVANELEKHMMNALIEFNMLHEDGQI